MDISDSYTDGSPESNDVVRADPGRESVEARHAFATHNADVSALKVGNGPAVWWGAWQNSARGIRPAGLRLLRHLRITNLGDSSSLSVEFLENFSWPVTVSLLCGNVIPALLMP